MECMAGTSAALLDLTENIQSASLLLCYQPGPFEEVADKQYQTAAQMLLMGCCFSVGCAVMGAVSHSIMNATMLC